MAGAVMVLTPGVGVLADSLYDEQAHARIVQEHEAALQRARLLERGWRPLTSWDVSELRTSHGVEVRVATRVFNMLAGNGTVEGRKPDSGHLDTTLPILLAELRRYPPGMLRMLNMERVVLVSDLKEETFAIPSLPNVENTLLMDVQSPPDFLRRLIHHEVFHFMDFADDGEVGDEGSWGSLNEPLFRYAAGGRTMREPNSAALTDELPGFVSLYARSAVEEDKAELFAFLMVAPTKVADIASRDHKVASKVRALLEIVSRSSPVLAARLQDAVLSS
jgi:hypothetical protein